MKLHHMIVLSAVLLTLTACTVPVVQPAVDNSAAPVVEAAAPSPRPQRRRPWHGNPAQNRCRPTWNARRCRRPWITPSRMARPSRWG
ncbi:MAG: hypothetical protein IPK16_16605 [Anaerolineales bacterium]|nr:hypothetical protein [Anaerolineales bacterium]